MAKKRNPQDSTRRNVQATNKRLAAIVKRLQRLERLMRERT